MTPAQSEAARWLAESLLALTRGDELIAQDCARRAHEVLADARHERERNARLADSALVAFVRPLNTEGAERIVRAGGGS